MIKSFNFIFLSFISTFLISIFLTSISFVFFKATYGHGLSRDESLPFDISGRQIAIEGILEPPFLNESKDQKPTFLIRTHDEKTNETIKDINYRIIIKFKNETIFDQRFHAIDGVISANLIPSKTINSYEIINKDEGKEEQVPLNISQNDLVEVSSDNPVTIKSKLLADGGLYDILVILEKSSNGLKLDTDKNVNLFISIGKDFPFIITNYFNNSKNNNNSLTLTVKTFYDEILDFFYDQENSRISFKMPFTWNLEYVNQVVNLHQELIIPKSYIPLSTVSAFTGTLNGMEIPRNSILIDDYSDQNNRIVHVVIVNFKLKELTNQIIKNGGNEYAIFEIESTK
jgi:hypothetical protein